MTTRIKNKTNTLVYKYGGESGNQNHKLSLNKGKIARTGKKGVAPKNKNIGDQVLVISDYTHLDEVFYDITLGTYLGEDPQSEDIWNDSDSTYDRDCVELFAPIKTKMCIKKSEFLQDAILGSGLYNDNSKNSIVWKKMLLAS
tara:strand:+ start:2186 stop:2614 length:429 start_codon:yes stop_codon:yes gene_type:complete